MSENLKLEELIPARGTWSGLLFENPATDYQLASTWTFAIDFAEVRRDYGATSPNLVIDWIPAGTAGWREMAGRSFKCSTFAEPIEASVYFFAHHRFDQAELQVIEQRGSQVDLLASLAGDLDGLGLPAITVSTSADFAGIYVQCARVGTDTTAAADLLGDFTDIAGLRPLARSHNVVFEARG